MSQGERPHSKKKCGLLILKPHGKAIMKLICASCNRLKEEEEFDWWFRAIRVRKRECRVCERKYYLRWMLKELEKQKRRKGTE